MINNISHKKTMTPHQNKSSLLSYKVHIAYQSIKKLSQNKRLLHRNS